MVYAILEKMPFRTDTKAGAIATFKKAEAAAFWEMAFVAAGVPYETVMAHVWMPRMGIPRGAGKDVHRQLAEREFPGTTCFKRVKDDGRADAALLALYAYRRRGEKLARPVEVYQLGIDPGVSGAMAILDSDGRLVDVFDSPTYLLAQGSNARGHDVAGIWDLVRKAKLELQESFV